MFETGRWSLSHGCEIQESPKNWKLFLASKCDLTKLIWHLPHESIPMHPPLEWGALHSPCPASPEQFPGGQEPLQAVTTVLHPGPLGTGLPRASLCCQTLGASLSLPILCQSPFIGLLRRPHGSAVAAVSLSPLRDAMANPDPAGRWVRFPSVWAKVFLCLEMILKSK